MNIATLRFTLLNLAENFKASKSTYRHVAIVLIFGKKMKTSYKDSAF
jgi:hypothetical protein